MITQYVRAAMARARFEQLEDGSWYGEIPGFQGVYANADTREECVRELQEVLEEWLVLSFEKQLPIPVIDGMDLAVRKDVA